MNRLYQVHRLSDKSDCYNAVFIRKQCYNYRYFLLLFLLLHVGTLGQEKQWWLGDASTYQHPLAPVDVLLDPLSIPEMRCASQLVKDEERESPEQRWQGGSTVLDVENEEEEEVRSSLSPLYQIAQLSVVWCGRHL